MRIDGAPSQVTVPLDQFPHGMGRIKDSFCELVDFDGGPQNSNQLRRDGHQGHGNMQSLEGLAAVPEPGIKGFVGRQFS